MVVFTMVVVVVVVVVVRDSYGSVDSGGACGGDADGVEDDINDWPSICD